MQLILKESNQPNIRLKNYKIKGLVIISGIIAIGYALIYVLYLLDVMTKQNVKTFGIMATLCMGIFCIGLLFALGFHFYKSKNLATLKILCKNQHLLYFKNDKLKLEIPLKNIINVRFGMVTQSVNLPSSNTYSSVTYEALSIYYQKNRKHTKRINTTFINDKATLKRFVSFINNKEYLNMNPANDFHSIAQAIENQGKICGTNYLKKSLGVVQAFQIGLGEGNSLTLEETADTQRIVHYNSELIEFLKITLHIQQNKIIKCEKETHKHYGEYLNVPPKEVLHFLKTLV